MSDSRDDTPQAPTPTLWPIGFAIGIACVLVGLVVSWPAVVLGVVVTAAFGLLWARDTTRERAAAGSDPVGTSAPAVSVASDDEPLPETHGRAGFLTLATVGLGGVIGAGVTLPALGFAVLPSFTGEGVATSDVDLGPISNFPEGTFVITSFTGNKAQGPVSRRTVYIRNNGLTAEKEPSFTIIYSRCVHLGCPVQPNGPKFEDKTVKYKDVVLTPVQPAGFGCPCHGGAYDTEGNRTAGPPVRSLDRYAYSIVDGNLVLGDHFSVGTVDGSGKDAKISRYREAYPGVHVDGIERWLYPIPVPGS